MRTFGYCVKGIKMVEGEAYKAPSDVAEEGFMVVE